MRCRDLFEVVVAPAVQERVDTDGGHGRQVAGGVHPQRALLVLGGQQLRHTAVTIRASNELSSSLKLYNHEEGTRAFSWLKVHNRALTFKNLLRHDATCVPKARPRFFCSSTVTKHGLLVLTFCVLSCG